MLTKRFSGKSFLKETFSGIVWEGICRNNTEKTEQEKEKSTNGLS